MKKSHKIALLLAVLAALSAAAFYFFYFIRTPAYALNEARAAIQQHDGAKFSRYVDVHSVMDNAFEDVIKAESQINHDNIFSNPFALSILHMLKPAVVELLTQEAMDRVTVPVEQPGKTVDPVPDAMKRNMERQVPVEKFTIKDLQLTSTEQGIAKAILALHNNELDKDFIAELQLEHNGQNWQIKKVSNLSELIIQLDAAKKAHQAAMNKPVLERLNKAVKTSGEQLAIAKDTSKPEQPQTLLTATVLATNMTQATINRMYYDVLIFNEQEEQIYSYPEHFLGTIAPGQAVALTTTKKLNALLPDDKMLMEAGVSKDKCKIRITYLAFNDGSVLSSATFLD